MRCLRICVRTWTASALVLGALAGCASGDTGADAPSTPPTSSSSAASPSASPSEQLSDPAEDSEDGEDMVAVALSVSVRDGNVAPPPRRVKVEQGAAVRLTITLDVDDVVHVHGYEIEEPVEAGRPATIELVAGDRGVFEVETHDSGLTLLQLEVR